VRVVLKAVYDKLDLSRQSQLAVLTTRLRSIQP
jgi:DNA-binding CsgD family transcriptional regulator